MPKHQTAAPCPNQMSYVQISYADSGLVSLAQRNNL